MTNFLLIPIGSHGDVHPFVGVGQALRDRGHPVKILTNGYFAPLVEKSGLEFVELATAEEFEEVTNDPELWDAANGWKVVFTRGMLPLVPRVYDHIAAAHAAAPGETVVVAATLALGARVAQDALGVPTITMHLQPSVFRSIYRTPRLPGPDLRWMPRPLKNFFFWAADHWVLDPVVAPAINAFRAEKGLPPVKRVLDQWWHSPQRVIGLFPEWFAPPQLDWPEQVRLTGFPLFDERGMHQDLSEELTRFLAAGDPPIAFTPGSAMRKGRDFFEASAEACRRLGRRGILLSRHREHIPVDLPPGVIHLDYAPFSELLPRCAALVHHGGVGTTAQALAAGVPQLIMPMSHDQPDNAERTKKLGVGDWIAPKAYTGEAVARSLGRLIGSEVVRNACRSIAQKFEGVDSIGQTCDLIEAFSREKAAASGQRLVERAQTVEHIVAEPAPE